MQKKFWALVVLVVCILAALIAWNHFAKSPGGSHTWATFTNTALGFSLQYPSDVLTPTKGSTTATTSITFDSADMTTPNPADIRISTQETNTKTIDGYLATIQTPFTPKETTIGGLPAREFDEMAHVDYSYYVLHNGKVFYIVINQPPTVAQRIKDSITFTN